MKTAVLDIEITTEHELTNDEAERFAADLEAACYVMAAEKGWRLAEVEVAASRTRSSRQPRRCVRGA